MVWLSDCKEMISEAVLIDNMEYMAKFPDKYFDLAVVDPPYGIGMASVNIGSSNSAKLKDYTKKNWDSASPSPEYFDLLKRKSKNQIIWGANHFIDNLPFNVSTTCCIICIKGN